MIWLARLGAVLFTVALATANVMYALQLGTNEVKTIWWVGVALGSAVWSIAGVVVLVAQVEARRWANAGAALVVLGLALSYDVLAAYGLSRQEQLAHAGKAERHMQHIAALEADVRQASAALAATPLVSHAEAQAALAAVTVAQAQCAEVVAPNKLRKFQADRIRAACEARTAALGLEAAVAARKARTAALERLRADLRAAKASAPASDPRLEILAPEMVAWAPVILVTLGGMLSGLALTAPPARAARLEVEAPPVDPPSAVAPASVSVELPAELPAPLQVTAERLLRLAQRDETPEGLERDGAGYLRGAQRRIAEAIGQPLAKVNRALRLLSAEGVVDLDTGGNGTAYRIAGAVPA